MLIICTRLHHPNTLAGNNSLVLSTSKWPPIYIIYPVPRLGNMAQMGTLPGAIGCFH